MTYRLSVDSLTNAASHLCKYGDTDVFPHLVELLFLSEQKSAVIDELKELDLDQYSPGNAFEALAPKSRFGFRIAHQLPLVDTILLLAAVIEIGNLIEAHRPSSGGIEAFSYRFQTNIHGGIFRNDHTFKDWLAAQHNHLNANDTFTTIISTDISDFYSRINFHRLDNLLDEVAPKHGASRYIIKHIKAIRAKQSFGLPVGGAAARLLAELALSDTDRALQQEGLSATRFVDDFRIFLGEQESPYDALALLARHLSLNEGLSLNVAKTRVQERNDYLLLLDNQITDVGSDAEGKALDALTSQLYTQEEPDPEELEKLKAMNLLGLLADEIDQDSLDMGRIKVIFRALKLTKTIRTIDYLIQEFHKLVIFSKEVTLLMHELEKDNSNCFDHLQKEVVKSVSLPPASSIQTIKTWLIELFVRGVVPVAPSAIKMISASSSVLDRRQLHLIRGRTGDKNYFRSHKTSSGQLSPFEQSCFIWGAACLPKDEYDTWLSTVKPMFNTPTGSLFLKWAQHQRENLIEKLNISADGHHD